MVQELELHHSLALVFGDFPHVGLQLAFGQAGIALALALVGGMMMCGFRAKLHRRVGVLPFKRPGNRSDSAGLENVVYTCLSMALAEGANRLCFIALADASETSEPGQMYIMSIRMNERTLTFRTLHRSHPVLDFL